MTESAQTIIDLAGAASHWVASHINAGGEIIRQVVPVAIVFGFVHMTPEQQAVLFASVSGVVAAITGSNTVSKVRVGERITEEVDRKMGTGDGR